jgi:hypothetical protein
MMAWIKAETCGGLYVAIKRVWTQLWGKVCYSYSPELNIITVAWWGLGQCADLASMLTTSQPLSCKRSHEKSDESTHGRHKRLTFWRVLGAGRHVNNSVALRQLYMRLKRSILCIQANGNKEHITVGVFECSMVAVDWNWNSCYWRLLG